MEESYDSKITDKNGEAAGISLAEFLDRWVESMYDQLEEMFPKEQDIKIADAVLTIFKTRNDLDIFKKKALYIYIREMTDCETPLLTKVINVLKEDFREKYQKLYDQGLIVNKVR
jgi:hypothetical protein